VCGIIGYVGSREAKPLLLEGLRRLEYRGYDSAGIALREDESLGYVRAVGNLSNLVEAAGPNGSHSHHGLGHTRWATHGAVTEENAHPLTGCEPGRLAIVLNGIIENYVELRMELTARQHRFTSETDAEVVVHLVERAYRGDLAAAVRAIYGRLEGHFAFVAVHRDEPDTLVGTRRQCPLLVGVGDGETFVASSLTAFGGETRRVVVVEDDEVVAVTADRVRVTSAAGLPIDRPEVEVEWDDEVAEKGGHETFMLKEIHEQPQAVGETIARDLERAPLDATHLGPIDLRGVRRLVVVSCGTAYHAGLVGRYAVEEWAGVPCDLDIASEWRHRNPFLEEGTLVVGISQSGETADTLASLRLARLRGARTLGITNSPGSQITREVDHVLSTHAGLEMGVAATKTFTAQVVLMNLLALRLAKVRASLLDEQIAPLLAELRALPHKIAACLEDVGAVDEIAERFHERPFFLYLGRHAGLPVCLEGALKLKEISYTATDAYAAGEMKHGPIALLDEGTPVVVVATDSPVLDKVVSNMQEVRARGASVIAVGGDSAAPHADAVLRVPDADWMLQPLLAVIPLQLLAYRIARLRGLNVDQPRNLAKTVTVE
jgi:glucosamine--fructose-6-phosphate aminotransferase (isomerizing)